MLIDSHCHLDRLNLDAYEGDLEAVLANARDHGVTHMLCVCINMENYPDVLAIARQHSNVFASAGVHPTEMKGREPTIDELAECGRVSDVVAIGETGLDYYHGEGDLEWQRERFRRHIQVARALSKPLIIHTRDARQDTIRIMREEQAGEAGGVMHCFTEDWDMAHQALDLGFYISFSGIVTFKNADELRDVARRVPDDRLLVETDSPYLAPVPYRGKPNQPAWVRYVAEQVAELRGTTLEEISAITSRNFFKLFTAASPGG
jgi:TatD DNase family protein